MAHIVHTAENADDPTTALSVSCHVMGLLQVCLPALAYAEG